MREITEDTAAPEAAAALAVAAPQAAASAALLSLARPPAAAVLSLQRQAGNRAVTAALAQRQVLSRKTAAAFVNTSQSITDYYTAKGKPDAGMLKQAADLQAEIDKLVEEEVKVRDEIDAVSQGGADPPADKLKRLYELRGMVFGKLLAQGSTLSHLQDTVPPEPVPDPPKDPKKVPQPTEEEKLWNDIPKNPLEASVAHAMKIWRWVMQWQVDDLTKQIAATKPDDTQKLEELKKKRKDIVTQLRTGVYASGQAAEGGVRDIKQWRGPWANRAYYDSAGKTSYDYDSDHVAKISSSACGPTSLAIIIDYLSQSDPEGLLARKEDLRGEDLVLWVLKFAEDAGAHAVTPHKSDDPKFTHGAESQGTSGQTMADKLRGKLGSLRAKALKGNDEAKDQLDQGHLVICLTHNHFVVIDDYRDPQKGSTMPDWHVQEVGNKWGGSDWASTWTAEKQAKVGWGQMWAFWGGY